MSRSQRPSANRFAALARYFRDPDANKWGKGLVLFAALYAVFPLDLIPDVVPFVGWLDDLGVMSLALYHLARVSRAYAEPELVPVPVRRR